jgi:hypothetical protein
MNIHRENTVFSYYNKHFYTHDGETKYRENTRCMSLVFSVI